MTRDGLETLTEKEKQTLRLIGRGHDAKSMARHLGISVHTVNERLRFARRKMEVTSSREAARILLEREEAPRSLADKDLRDAEAAGPVASDTLPGGRLKRRSTLAIAGVLLMSVLIAAFLLTAPAQLPGVQRTFAQDPAPESAIVGAARDFLVLVDNGRWADSYGATTATFRNANTVAQWQAASQQARVPLGAALSRDLLSQDFVPAPPRGYAVVKFRTNFANKSGAVETVTLERDGAGWRVAGIVID